MPGLSQAARVVALTGLLVVAAACLESAWTRSLAGSPRRAFFIVFGCVLGLWLAVMLYGSYIWNLVMPFYRPLGIIMSIIAIGVAILGWSALETRNSRRGLVSLMVIAVALKLVHWGYYVPEWNYRYSQGPWGRAISQWVPKRWALYTFHDWPPDLAFFMKRPVRQLRSPTLSGIPGGPAKQVCVVASLGIRELAQVRSADHSGREISRSIGGRTHPGSDRRAPCLLLWARIPSAQRLHGNQLAANRPIAGDSTKTAPIDGIRCHERASAMENSWLIARHFVAHPS